MALVDFSFRNGGGGGSSEIIVCRLLFLIRVLSNALCHDVVPLVAVYGIYICSAIKYFDSSLLHYSVFSKMNAKEVPKK
jgi:hypothetical protein